MNPIIKSMWTNNVEIDLENYFPDDSTCFGLWIEFRVGLKKENAADDFRLFVCTPSWLEKECHENTVLWGRHCLIVSEYDFDLITLEMNRCIENCDGKDWLTIANKISRFAAWEFEDYSE